MSVHCFTLSLSTNLYQLWSQPFTPSCGHELVCRRSHVWQRNSQESRQPGVRGKHTGTPAAACLRPSVELIVQVLLQSHKTVVGHDDRELWFFVWLSVMWIICGSGSHAVAAPVAETRVRELVSGFLSCIRNDAGSSSPPRSSLHNTISGVERCAVDVSTD